MGGGGLDVALDSLGLNSKPNDLLCLLDILGGLGGRGQAGPGAARVASARKTPR